MTILIFLLYSDCMDADLKALELKLNQLLSFCRSLKDENTSLRATLNQSQQDLNQLQNNMQLASNKIEVLMQTLPAEISILELK